MPVVLIDVADATFTCINISALLKHITFDRSHLAVYRIAEAAAVRRGYDMEDRDMQLGEEEDSEGIARSICLFLALVYRVVIPE